MTGADVSSVVALLEGLGVDALGINCAMEPKEMLPVLEELHQIFVCSDYCKAKCRTSETERRENIL